jgi:DNA-binding NtrC family response regulator/Tfp pilus assembly protein PilF
MVISDPAFYRSINEGQEAISRYEKRLLREKEGSENWVNIKMGLLSIICRRLGLVTSDDGITKELARIRKYINGKPELALKHELLEAEYLLYAKQDFNEAKARFEKLAMKLKQSEHNLLYGNTSMALFIISVCLNDVTQAEEYAQDCLSIFRRFGSPILYGYCLNNYGVMKKKICEYSESEKLFRKALKVFEANGAMWCKVLSNNNIGIVKMKLGDYQAAEFYFNRAIELISVTSPNTRQLHEVQLNLGHIYLLQRRFHDAKQLFDRLLASCFPSTLLKTRALAMEFLGELYMETGDLEKAEKHLTEAQETAEAIAPESDVMTEVKRRLAQLFLLQGDLARAEDEARECIRICLKIRDKHELGAVMRTLAHIHLERGADRKAESAFEAGINILKSINEAYELMRTCLAYGEYLVLRARREADIYLLEAKQIASKLTLDYFIAMSMMLLGRHAMNDGNLREAKAYLSKAEAICNELRDPCRKKLAAGIRSAARELEKAVLRVDNDSVQKLKALGRIYEEARFPMKEVAPEVAMEVARSVGSESLFLAIRRNGRYCFPIKYNISAGDAGEIVKRIDCGNGRRLFGIHSPCIYRIGGAKLIGVPGRMDKGYVLCTIIGDDKNVSSQELEFLIASAEALERIAEEQPDGNTTGLSWGSMASSSRNKGKFKDIITRDPGMIKLIGMAERAAKTDVPILIQGETGVGKELFARAIHATSGRRDRNFVAINTGGIPVNFLESELFGYVKGAFTGACSDRKGLIEEALGGTLFLDEVGEMSEELQVKLLRLLENGEYRRLGENKVRNANVRIISATNRDIEALVKGGRFREDLFYRLSTVRFNVPALRFRRGDIELLVNRFLERMTSGMGCSGRLSIDVKAMEALELYSWPGNVRELQNEIMRIVSLVGDEEVIRFNMLSEGIRNYFRSHNETSVFEKSVERFERRLILKTLEENDWNRMRAAERMGIPRTTLLAKMRRLNIIA